MIRKALDRERDWKLAGERMMEEMRTDRWKVKSSNDRMKIENLCILTILIVSWVVFYFILMFSSQTNVLQCM